jgi:CheY-like chemotaxis protein
MIAARAENHPALSSILIVGASPASPLTLSTLLRAAGARVVETSLPEEGLALLPGAFDLVLMDAAIPLQAVLAIVDGAFAQPISPVFAMVGASCDPVYAFRIAKAGVHLWLPGPVSIDQLERLAANPDLHLRALETALRGLGGRAHLKQLQRQVREIVVRDALIRSRGSRRSAARSLGVTRPAVQKIARQSNGPLVPPGPAPKIVPLQQELQVPG